MFLRTRSFSEDFFFDAFFAFMNTIFRPLRITAELLVKSLHLAVQVKISVKFNIGEFFAKNRQASSASV